MILETLEDVIEFAGKWNVPNRRVDRPVDPTVLILGGGSNVLFVNDFHGTVVKIDTKGIRIMEEDDDHVLVQASAGEEWDGVVSFCVERGWGGLENLSGIPGNVGSSPIQNIGAYGTELKDHFHSLSAIEIRSGKKINYDKEECRFGYRDSIFKKDLKGRVIITVVTFHLTKKPIPNLSYEVLARKFQGIPEEDISIQQIRDEVLHIRASKLPDPKILGNAGSFFKNPIVGEAKLEELRGKFPGILYFINPPPCPLPNIREGDGGWVKETRNHELRTANRELRTANFKLAAGWLIEQCGWKGYREGDAGVHKDQALVLVNYGHATGKQIYDLSEKIRISVLERFGVELEREVNVI